MSGTTSRFALLYATGGDVVKTVLKTTLKTLAERVDYMLGESGDNTITPSAANTKTTKVINFARTYDTPPRVLLSPGRDGFANTITQGVMQLWVDDVTATSFTVGVIANNVTAREFTWTARPKNTDATL